MCDLILTGLTPTEPGSKKTDRIISTESGSKNGQDNKIKIETFIVIKINHCL